MCGRRSIESSVCVRSSWKEANGSFEFILTMQTGGKLRTRDCCRRLMEGGAIQGIMVLLCGAAYIDPDMTDGQSASQAAPVNSFILIVGSDTVSQFAMLVAQMMSKTHNRVFYC
ncbi:hypothetical protein MA16_Dca007019 [Dendrobium catenatum]|uniref:Uncharacterized protein n=1 Tax=Dendrobium catenatum TaxID=906689 RepID=A0A2I0VX46_9ASPA|nr:hypothetical protein MA16_Dca007019 [Dendrobium catenatum]